jgi:hypothetical protein
MVSFGALPPSPRYLLFTEKRLAKITAEQGQN